MGVSKTNRIHICELVCHGPHRDGVKLQGLFRVRALDKQHILIAGQVVTVGYCGQGWTRVIISYM